jgi:hypothetical protein
MLLLVSISFDKLYTYVYYKSTNTNRFQYFRNQKNKKFDYLFVGSSRVVNDINPITIDSLLHVKTINFGIMDARPKDILTILKLLKAYHIQSGKVFIQTDYYYNNSDKSNFLYVEMLPYINENNIISNYYLNDIDFFELKYIPFYRYCKNNFNLGLRNIISSTIKKKNGLNSTKGFEPLFGNETSFWVRELPKKIVKNNKYNSEMLTYLEKNKLNHQFFISPFRRDTKNISYLTLLKKQYNNIWDFSASISNVNYFKNGYHLNENGAKKFSVLLSNHINKIKK